jgi:alkylresorcinol/alkylpyrone synthase
MAYIQSTARSVPSNRLPQTQIKEFASAVFADSDLQLDRLLPVFENSTIQSRPILKDFSWYSQTRSFQEKNTCFLESALELGKSACLSVLRECGLSPQEIDGFLVVTSSGFVTPTLDARLIDELNMREDILRIPLTGLGCAGGAYGLARANELATLYPEKIFLLLAVETCSLTFRPADKRKANLVALSLFSDGASAVVLSSQKKEQSLFLKGSHSFKWKHSLDVMGWDVEADGLQVIFDKSIPTLIRKNYKDVFQKFLDRFKLPKEDLVHFLYHPGGKKVLDAFSESLGKSEETFQYSAKILREYGNMSSPTVLFVIDEFLNQKKFEKDEHGIIGAMGPGFSSESILFSTT